MRYNLFHYFYWEESDRFVKQSGHECQEKPALSQKMSLAGCRKTCSLNGWCKGFTMELSYLAADKKMTANPDAGTCELFNSCTIVTSLSKDLFSDQGNSYIVIQIMNLENFKM